MNSVKCEIKKLVIPTYPEPAAEEMPMFAENRVHQRTSGRPYPNKVVLKVNREEKIDKEYTAVVLENEYLKIEILPEIGGRIYSALDKTTGYDFFYKQHVIKPALIGVLGSWISGGVEFNWPFHHRASGFMPCDFVTEALPDGSAVCHLSEHDPIDRMKGMVSIILRPGEKRFETRMRLYNRTDTAHSFLWWENAAVPVHEKYQIFFPQDVSYVNFHYLKSRITYPLAGNGIFNGIPMDEVRDISYHKNTVPATSYFAAASDYDFFGGYDHARQCGVVHIGDHHLSPGKKMFTWGYCQLAKSWENALTDTDGQYAELMAGSYSDNQPNFSWLEPYETKEFSQYWYPISKIGTPTFANLDIAFKIDRENGKILVQPTKTYENAEITVKCGDKILLNTVCDLKPEICEEFTVKDMPEYVTVTAVSGGETVGEYTEKNFDKFNMPDVITDMPSAAGMNSAEELYLAGVHVAQYRDPAVEPDSYWKEALKRDINHIPSLVAMAEYEYGRYAFESARDYADRAIKNITIYNERPQSGKVYYIYALILEALGEYKAAYDYYYKAAWSADSVSKAMTRIAMLDIRNKDYKSAIKHAETALDYGRNDSLAAAVKVIALKKLGCDASAEITAQLEKDSLDHCMRYLSGKPDFYGIMDSNPLETVLDIVFDFDAMGLYEENVKLLSGLLKVKPDSAQPMLYYALGYYKYFCGEDGKADYINGAKANIGATFPVRKEEMRILEDVIVKTDDNKAKMLLGCLLYNKRHYEKAANLWEQCDDCISVRNLAVAYFSHLNRKEEALPLMKKAISLCPDSEQLIYESAVLMDKLCVPANEKIKFLNAHKITRDDCFTELAKAYNQDMQPEKSIETLMSHNFVPCEGGEHAIADQYLFAHLVIGSKELEKGNTEKALEIFKKGQVLPQSLGAGIWNHCKLVPLKFFEALCLEETGKKSEADEIFSYIANIGIEYFSNMHLKELPYYQAHALLHLGENIKAQRLITRYRREWSGIDKTADNGFFGTTPFFISFTDDPNQLRRALHCYLNALICDFTGEKEKAQEYISESLSLNSENLPALSFKIQGFLH